ncbi:PA14 domain-containing protein [Vulcanococcus sp. Clear-D1]|uniref:PA14 domain-containing protein n=1 Tax=Vulcanococcus sp. Clear-D1 TaxID=2766970 RepID=UPI0019C77554|nr:PA14 domain-containing protein [Vulcanococcus sp. Clear-D1]MBD1194943.1 hypothetical protein [Vulcanococcus sp. Clear-D1]
MGVNTGNARPYWGNGHYYAFTQETAKWHDGRDRSQAQVLNGLNGYLATITSSGENDFIKQYSFGGRAIPGTGFIAGTDDNAQGTSESNWIWKAPGSAEDGVRFRSGSTNTGYANWNGGEPNNKDNEDFMVIYNTGYWNDDDPDNNSGGGYVTEWGKSGVEFTAGFTALNTNNYTDYIANGYENGSALPKMTITFDRFVPDDYVDIRNSTALIDIPITFGGTAVLNTDYTISLTSSGNSSISNGILYVKNTQSVTLNFNPINNNTWQAPRTITATLGADGSEGIYGLTSTTGSQVWLFDDEPLLSLGQGTYKFIRAPYIYTSSTNTLPANSSDLSTNADVLVFDSDGIYETDTSFNAAGLYDTFAIRWETYIRIPETGNYVFRCTSDEGRKLTVKRNDSNGTVLDSFSNWVLTGTSSSSTKNISLNKGDVVWIQYDYFENYGGATAGLYWDRPNGSGGTISNELVPASAMFLSKELAQGVNRSEPSSDQTSLGFQLFANKNSNALDVKLSSSSESANTTANSTLAQRRTASTKVGDDYALISSNAVVSSDLIGLNGVVNGARLSSFGQVANAATMSRDTATSASPVNGVPLRMVVSNNDPYLVTYNSSTWNVAEAKQGETWTLSVYAKADRSTTGQLFIFEANENGAYTKAPATTIQIGTDWQRYSFSYTFADPASRYIQVRLDGPDSGGTNTVIWWDGVQLEKSNQASTFTTASSVNRFAGKFNPLDLYNAGVGTTQWTPNQTPSSLKNYRDFDLTTYRDDYAEGTESVTLNLIESTGYGVDNKSQTLTIGSNGPVLSIRAGQNPTEGGSKESDLGWFTITSNVPIPKDLFKVRYAISGGTAIRGIDYTAPQATLTTANFKAEDIVVMSQNSTEAKIYIAAIADAIREGTETVTVKLVQDLTTDDKGFSNYNYSIDAVNNQATLNITDSNAYIPAVVVTPADRTGSKTVRALLVNGQQQGSFDVHLTSQPQSTVTLNLSTTSGTLSTKQLTFSSSNWSSPQRVTLNDQRTDQDTTVSITSTSSDSYYSNLKASQRLIPSNWSTELDLTLWEGGALVPIQPAAGVIAIDGSEDANSRLGFKLTLGAPVIDTPVELLYQLTASNGFVLSDSGDAIHQPDATYKPLVLQNTSTSGGNAYAEVSGLTTVSNEREFSAQAWVRRDAVTTSAGILEFSDSNNSNLIKLGFSGSTNQPQLEIRDSAGAVLINLIAESAVALAEWNHLAFNVDRHGVASLYLNGELAKRGHLSNPSALVSKARSLNSFGRSVSSSSSNSTSGFLNGAIRNVGIWNASRSQEQIKASMLDAALSGTGLVGAWPLNNSTSNGVAGAASAVLKNGSSNTASFASTPFYGIQIPVDASRVSLPIVPIDDLSAEGSESLTLTLIDSGRYSVGGSSGTATAVLDDNDEADVLFLAATERGSDGSGDGWTVSNQFRVEEADPTPVPMGIRLGSKPSANVTLSLNTSSFSSKELKVTGSNNATSVQLTFTPDTWDQVQQVQIQGVDDNNDDNDISQWVSFNVSSNDAIYAGLAPGVTVVTVDDDATTANEALASEQNSSAPLAQLSLPSLSSIGEAGKASFTISLPSAASVDTLVFADLDLRLSDIATNDITLSIDNSSQSMAGLRRFDTTSGSSSETIKLDKDGINETSTSFSSNNQNGSFTSTWSGYVRIQESGWYTFSVPVQGGVRLSLDGKTVIDKYFDSKSTWNADTIQLEQGDYVAVKLDYSSFNTSSPSVSLRWTRPGNGGAGTVDEVIPSSAFSLTDGFSLLIPQGSSSASFNVTGLQDSRDEHDETIAISLLAARGVELLINEQSTSSSGRQVLQASLNTTDRESITLPAGTVLNLGENLTSTASQSDTIASFTLDSATTVYRDRVASLSGELSWTSYGQTTNYNTSVSGLVAGYGGDRYQVADPSVSLTLAAPLNADSTGSQSYKTSFTLDATNRGTVDLPAGTTLTYTEPNTDKSVVLQLSNTLSIKSGQTISNVAVTTTSVSSGLDISSSNSPIVGTSSLYLPPNNSQLLIKDDDQAGLLFSSDSQGTKPISSSTRTSLKEAGASVTSYVALSSQPTDVVTVYLETSDSSEALLQLPGSNQAPAGNRVALTFSPDNWKTTQAFTVLPADDKLVDGTINVDIHSRTASSDSFFSIREAGILGYSVTDNDQAKLVVELQQTSISRAGNGSLNLSLTAQPTDDVVVTLVPSDTQFTINDRSGGRSETVTFTPDNWSTAQTVTLWAVDDNTTEDITSSQLQLSTTSTDSRFNALSITPVGIDIVDNDLPTASISLVTDSTEEAKPGRFSIQLTNPAPSSAGSDGVVVNYQITAISLDSGLGYAANPSSINKITQLPGTTSGSVRIAPGQTTADALVVPIDDFYSDSINKAFTVQLTSGTGYNISDDSNTNSASVQIINNDIAGIALIISGDRVSVEESGDPATFQLALMTQPSHNVTVTINELIASGGTRQLGSSSTGFTRTLTFTPSNWFVPQQISVQSYDDARIEDGTGAYQFTGIHPAQLQYSFSSDDSAYNSKSNKSDHFTNLVQDVDVVDFKLPNQTAESLNSSLTSLQEGIDSLALPIVGSLDGKAGGGLRKFITNLVNSVRQIGTPTPSKLSKLLSSEIASALGVPEESVTVKLAMQGTSAVVVSFQFADSYDIFSVPLAADFGLPGLGLQSSGSLDASFAYDAGLELVFPRSGDVYLNTASDKTYLSADFNTSLSPDFSLTGGLGFLQLDAVNQPSVNENVTIQGEAASTELDVSFELDLNGGAGSDNKLTYTELISSALNVEELFQYELSGNAAMSFGVTTSINGSAAIPSFSFDLASLLPIFDYSNKAESEKEENATNIFFDNIKLDLGTYITQMLNPIVDGLDQILNPLYPIVDALYADTQIFATIGIENAFDVDNDGHVTAIDLAQWFADLYSTFDPVRGTELKATIDATVEFLDVVKGVMDLIRDLETMSEEGNFYIDYGSYELEAFSAGNPEAETEAVSVDEASTPELNDETASQADAGGSGSGGKSSSTFKDIMKQLDELGFQIPLIDDPKNAIKLLLGQDVDLFVWHMPGMGMSSEIEESFPIYAGIEGIIEGGFGIDANIGFGFDTHGLNEWKDDGFEASEAWKVFNGFYVADLDANGVDIPEFSIDATMGAGLGLSALVVRADITGGLEAAASFDLLDEGEIAGTADGKIRGSEISDRISNPLDLFELVGSLSAYLKSKVQVGLDMGFYSIWDTVWQEKLASIPLFEFGVGGSYGSGTVSNGYLEGTTVFFDANGNGQIDLLEPSTTVSDDAHYNLRIDHRRFDRNRNGKIDADEGRLTAFGGIDSSTGLPLKVPFLAPLGQMLTPLTTLHSLGIAQGMNEAKVNRLIRRSFGLGDFDYLSRDPVLMLENGSDQPIKDQLKDLAAYAAHIKVNFLWDVLANGLQQLLPKQFPDRLPNELQLLEAFAKEFFTLPTETPNNDRLAVAALREIKQQLDIEKPKIARMAKLAAKLAANASWELSNQLDAIINHVRQGEVSPQQALALINSIKSDSFDFYRNASEKINEGLYKVESLSDLRQLALGRLQAVHRSFVKDYYIETGIEALDQLSEGWQINPDGINISRTPFSSVNILEKRKTTLGNRQLEVNLERRPDDQASIDEPARVLADLRSFGLNERTNGKAFTYYTDTDTIPIPFLFNPNTQTGARLFNLGKGQPLLVELSFRDGEIGDRNQATSGIKAVGTSGEVKQTRSLSTDPASRILSISAPLRRLRSGAVFARTELSRPGSKVNQVGYLLLEPGEQWDPSSLTLDALRQRLQILGAGLTNKPEFSQRLHQFSAGNRLVFIEVMNATLDDLTAAGSTTLDQLSKQIGVLEVETTQLQERNSATIRSEASDLAVELTIQTTDPGLMAFIARQQNQATVLDFTGLDEAGLVKASVMGTLEISGDKANRDTVAGFYRVLNNNGTVRDHLTGNMLDPGQEGYLQAALHETNLLGDLNGLTRSNQHTIRKDVTISEAALFAPYAIVNTDNSSITYAAFSQANPDNKQHFQVIGDNTFALESDLGGRLRDFDDLTLRFSPSGLVS